MTSPASRRAGRKGPFDLFMRFGVLGTSQIVGSAISFLTVLIITRTGGAATFGQIILAVSVMQYALTVTIFGTNITGVGETAARPKDVSVLLPSILLIRLLFAALSYSVILMAGPWIAPDPDARLVLYIVGASVFTSAFFPTWLPQGKENLPITALTMVGPFALTFIFSAVAAFVRPEAWAFGLARLAADSLMALGLTLWVIKFAVPVPLAVITAKAKAIIIKSASITGSQLVRGLSLLSDVLIVGWFVSDAMLGYFSAAHRIFLLLVAISSAYFVVLYPRLAQASAEGIEQLRAEMMSSLKPSVPGALAIAIIVALAAPLAMPLAFGASFSAAIVPMQFLGAAAAISFVYRTFGQTLMALEKAHLFLWATAISTIIGIALKIMGIQFWGISGASAAILAAECIMLFLSGLFVRRELAKAR